MICGLKQDLLAASTEILSKLDHVQVPTFLNSLINDKSAPATNGGKITTYLPHANANSFSRLSIFIIPKESSRINCPLRPELISKFVSEIITAANTGDNVYTGIRFLFILPKLDKIDYEQAVYTLGGCLGKGCPTYTRKSAVKENIVVQCSFVKLVDEKVVEVNDESILYRANVINTAIRRAANIIDQPCSEFHSQAFGTYAAKIVEELQENPDVKGQVTLEKYTVGTDLEKEGFGGIYGVGKAAAHPPCLVVLKYEPEKFTETVAWVGKGIVYDTGLFLFLFCLKLLVTKNRWLNSQESYEHHEAGYGWSWCNCGSFPCYLLDWVL